MVRGPEDLSKARPCRGSGKRINQASSRESDAGQPDPAHMRPNGHRSPQGSTSKIGGVAFRNVSSLEVAGIVRQMPNRIRLKVMSLLDMHCSQLRREQEQAAKDQRAIADISSKLARKQSDLARAKTASRERSLNGDIDRLLGQRARAEKSLAAHQRKSANLQATIAREEAQEQKRCQRANDRSAAHTAGSIHEVRSRVASLEETLLLGVQDAVASDQAQRQHDVFLSHAGPDRETAEYLFGEMTARELDVWFDGAELRLGESLTRQIDCGIAASRVGVILVTQTLLTGRYWTEREMGALISFRRRLIPVLDGVTFEELSAYSPLLADLIGLSTEHYGFDDIAGQIAATLQPAHAES